MNLPPRTQWAFLWSALPAGEIGALAESCADDCEVVDLSLPQAGLSLLKLRDSALGDTWYLGEIPVACARVRLRAADGRTAEGGAQILDDRVRLVRHLAILDAVLANRLPGWERAAALLDQGAVARAQETAARRALLGATRVAFAMLNAAGGEDE